MTKFNPTPAGGLVHFAGVSASFCAAAGRPGQRVSPVAGLVQLRHPKRHGGVLMDDGAAHGVVVPLEARLTRGGSSTSRAAQRVRRLHYFQVDRICDDTLPEGHPPVRVDVHAPRVVRQTCHRPAACRLPARVGHPRRGLDGLHDEIASCPHLPHDHDGSPDDPPDVHPGPHAVGDDGLDGGDADRRVDAGPRH